MAEFKSYIQFFIGFVISCSVIVILMRWLGPDLAAKTANFHYQSNRVADEFLEKQSNDRLDILVLGESLAGKNIAMFKWANTSAFMFATHGGSLIDSYFFLEKYFKLKQPPKCVIVLSSYGAYSEHMNNYFWSTLVPSYSYSLGELTHLYNTSRSVRGFPSKNYSLLHYWYKILESGIWKNGFSWPGLQDVLFNRESVSRSSNLYRIFRLNRGASEMSWYSAIKNEMPIVTESENHYSKDFQAEPVLDKYIIKIFNLLAQKKVNTYLIMSPLAEKLNNAKTHSWMAEYIKHVSILIGENKFIHNKISSLFWPNAKFYDGIHLIAEGAKEYSIMLNPLVNACKSDQVYGGTLNQ